MESEKHKLNGGNRPQVESYEDVVAATVAALRQSVNGLAVPIPTESTPQDLAIMAAAKVEALSDVLIRAHVNLSLLMAQHLALVNICQGIVNVLNESVDKDDPTSWPELIEKMKTIEFNKLRQRLADSAANAPRFLL
jgi:hypothetical protein